ncbi:hypothetical protein ASG73_14905 [Janibacter sp. Soil728]|uniref:DUF3152 domain-containing protein n=1 Tax=Janibacter sp. Soil728 TaxID=1736393 RepID=UPI0006F28A27|nr:DUF3152 domain-containing protein [Janibacter sp. Soil728]KRE35957.1 hypothetical protein ASG73_14905 [Janibacter sp. Soil728]
MPSHRPLAPRDVDQARRRQVAAVLAVVVLIVAIAVGLKGARASESEQSTSPGPASPAGATSTTSTTPPSSTTTSPTRATTSSTTTSPTRATPSSSKRTYRSTGRYRAVPTRSPVRGTKGELITYRIEVEQGARVSPRGFATAVDRTLRHPRGWTARGHWRFQRVTTTDADLTIRLATPDTVDKQCAAAGANTHGYTSCRAGQYVLLNLDRWLEGVPHIKDLELYRHYLVNHEVGHGLGLGHQRCPRKGSPAPVMVQQTLSLHGCTANAWPRSADGRLITGPSAP